MKVRGYVLTGKARADTLSLMAQVTLCDHRDNKGQPCGDRANVTASLVWDDKRFEIDLCDVHSKSLTANAREASTSRTDRPESVTRLQPSARTGRKVQEQLVDKIDYVDLRAWLEGQGLLPTGSRGRIKQELQQKWLDEGSPRPV